MINYIDSGKVTPNLLSKCKQGMRVLDDTFDAQIEGLLHEALLEAQRAYSVALIPCVVEWVDNEVSGDRVVLPLPVDEVRSVVVDGNEVGGWALTGDILSGVHGDTCSVIYTTKVYEGNLDLYLPSVFEYARARYEGRTKKEARGYLL